MGDMERFSQSSSLPSYRKKSVVCSWRALSESQRATVLRTVRPRPRAAKAPLVSGAGSSKPMAASACVRPVTQALAAMGFELPAPDTRGAFEARGRGRMVRSTVARWDSDKRWLLAMETVAALKRQHWHPHLMARGGVEAHGGEVVTAAAGAGVRVVERPLPQPGVPGLLRVLEELHEVDVVSLRSPLDSDSCRVLFHGSAAVLANSGREPFGLVGLETMAVDGVACTGCSGED